MTEARAASLVNIIARNKPRAGSQDSSTEITTERHINTRRKKHGK